MVGVNPALPPREQVDAWFAKFIAEGQAALDKTEHDRPKEKP